MAELFRDIAQAYPIVGVYTQGGSNVSNNPDVWGLAEKFIDARIVLTMGPADLTYANKLGYSSIVSVYLSGNSSSSNTAVAHVAWNKCVNGEMQVSHTAKEIPVFVGRDAPAMSRQSTQSYVLCSESAVFGEYLWLLHPDCIFIEKMAPRIHWYLRGPVMSEDKATGDPIALGEEFDKDIKLADGNNTAVTGQDDTLTLSASEGAGLGVYAKPPYSDTEDEEYRDGRCIALRSINGLYNDVYITGSESVSVQVAGDSNNLGIDIYPVTASEETVQE